MKWFVGVEVICLAAFILFMVQGRESLAWLSLLGPLQLLAWAILARSDLLILLFFAFLFPLAPVEFIPHPFHRYVLFPGTIALLALFRFSWFVHGPRSPRPGIARSYRAPALAFVCSMLLSFVLAFWHGWGSQYLLTYNVLMGETITLAYFYATVPGSADDIRKLLFASGAAAVLVCLAVPLLSAAHGTYLFAGRKVRVGLFDVFDMNTLGGIVAIYGAALLGLAFSSRRPAVKAVLALSAPIMLVALIASRSRGAWLGLAAALLYVLARNRSLKAVLSVAGVALLILVSDALRNTLLMRMGETSAQDVSLAGRLSIWQCALRMVHDHWLTGVGWENFRVLKVHYGFPTNMGRAVMMRFNTHNVMLEMLVDLGVIGLTAFLWLFIGAILRTDKIARGRGDNAGLAVAVNAGLVAFFAHGLWDCLTGIFMVPAAFLGLAMCLWRIDSGRPRPGAPSETVGRTRETRPPAD